MTFSTARDVYSSLKAGDTERVRQLFVTHPELRHEKTILPTWLHEAAATGNIKMVSALLDMNFDINSCGDAGYGPIVSAIRKGHLDVCEFLLWRGADPSLGRPLTEAITRPKDAIRWVRLLVEHGADIRATFHPYNDAGLSEVSILRWAETHGNTEVVTYLRSLLGGEVSAEASRKSAGSKGSAASEIVEHFAQQYAPVGPLSMQEIVPSGMPIAIRVIRPTERHRHLTLFTIGMCEEAMTAPAEHLIYRVEEYRFAELLIHLPPDWPLDPQALAKPEFNWPIHWLRNLARYPHEHQTWLGGPFVMIANGDPPEPLAPRCPFVALMLAAKSEVRCSDGRLVQLYTVLPLYREEYLLERQHDLPSLLRVLDAAGVGDAVDLQRTNAAVRRKG